MPHDVHDLFLPFDPAHREQDRGALGFWAAMRKVWPTTREQRPRGCWMHKTANVLDKMPKYLQPDAKDKLYQI